MASTTVAQEATIRLRPGDRIGHLIQLLRKSVQLCTTVKSTSKELGSRLGKKILTKNISRAHWCLKNT